MSAAVLDQVASSGSARLLADIRALDGRDAGAGPPALSRLEEALGPELADRLVAALTSVDARSPHSS